MRWESDEEVAKAVLARLPEGPLRQRAANAPVSRETVRGWLEGNYSMYSATRDRCVAWLEGREGPGFAEGFRAGVAAAKRAAEEGAADYFNRLDALREQYEADDAAQVLEDVETGEAERRRQKRAGGGRDDQSP